VIAEGPGIGKRGPVRQNQHFLVRWNQQQNPPVQQSAGVVAGRSRQENVRTEMAATGRKAEEVAEQSAGAVYSGGMVAYR